MADDDIVAIVPKSIKNSSVIVETEWQLRQRDLLPTESEAAYKSRKTLSTDSVPLAKGVFSHLPLSTAKYFRHIANRDRNYVDTMARMFLEVNPDVRATFIDSLEGRYTKNIASVLSTDVNSVLFNEGVAPGYFDFILQRVDHMYSEKVQIVETLSDNYVAFFFGASAPVFTYSGYLMNTFEDDWTMNMYRLFTELGRGTQLAKRGLTIGLKYDSIMVRGAMMDLRWALESTNETAVSFSFQLLVKKVKIWLGSVGTPSVTLGNVDILREQDAIRENKPLQEKVDPVSTTPTTGGSPSGTVKEEYEKFDTANPAPQGPHDPNGNGYTAADEWPAAADNAQGPEGPVGPNSQINRTLPSMI